MRSASSSASRRRRAGRCHSERAVRDGERSVRSARACYARWASRAVFSSALSSVQTPGHVLAVARLSSRRRPRCLAFERDAREEPPAEGAGRSSQSSCAHLDETPSSACSAISAAITSSFHRRGRRGTAVVATAKRLERRQYWSRYRDWTRRACGPTASDELLLQHLIRRRPFPPAMRAESTPAHPPLALPLPLRRGPARSEDFTCLQTREKGEQHVRHLRLPSAGASRPEGISLRLGRRRAFDGPRRRGRSVGPSARHAVVRQQAQVFLRGPSGVSGGARVDDFGAFRRRSGRSRASFLRRCGRFAATRRLGPRRADRRRAHRVTRRLRDAAIGAFHDDDRRVVRLRRQLITASPS